MQEEGEYKPSLMTITEIISEINLLKHQVELTQQQLTGLQNLVSQLEKSDAVTKEQLKTLFSNIEDIKDITKDIQSRLTKRDEQDKELLEQQIKQYKETKLLLLGAVFTALASVIIPLLFK